MRYIFYSIIFFCALEAGAQLPTSDEEMEQLPLFSETPEQYENMADLYTEYRKQPADINKIDRSTLEQLSILNEEQLDNFLQYREKCGPILSIYELQVIDRMDENTIRRLIQFCEVKEKKNYSRKSPNNKSLLSFRMNRIFPDKKGFSGAYAGSPWSYSFRYRKYIPGNYSYGITLEQDAGEAFEWKPSQRKYLSDYISVHAALYNRRFLKNIVAGDYQLQFGEGLVFSSFFAGKGGDVITGLKRAESGMKPHTSVGENNFFRGISLTMVKQHWSFTPMFSSVRKDASLSPDSLQEISGSSIYSSGLHRTNTEMQNRKSILVRNIGANIRYDRRYYRIGGNVLYTKLSNNIRKKDKAYEQFNFVGREHTILSTYYNFRKENFMFFGETAFSGFQALGFLQGVLISFSSSMEMSFFYRKYDRNFHSFYGNSFGEQSPNRNESGFCISFKTRLLKICTLQTRCDFFRFPWLRYQTDRPSEGKEYLVSYMIQPDKQQQVSFQYRSSIKEENFRPEESHFNSIVPVNTSQYRISYNYKTTPEFSFHTQLIRSFHKKEITISSGFMIVQEFSFQKRQWKLKARIALFETDDFYSRIYVYEPGVYSNGNFPFFYGKGRSTFLIFQYKISKKTNIDIKYSVLYYSDRNTLGSGNEMITGPKRSDFGLQLNVKL